MSEADRRDSADLLRWISWAQMKAGEEWFDDRDLSRQQAFVLGYLVQNPGAIQRQLAEVSRTTPANVSMLLQGLERRGYVQRRSDTGNERSKRVFATDDGARAVAGFATAKAAATSSILAPLSDEEREHLHALLLKVTARLPQPTRD